MELPWGRQEENKYNKFIREKIRAAREEKRMSQEELATAIHRSRLTVTNLENGRTEVNAVDLMGIAYILEKPIRYFFPVYVPTEGDLADKEHELIHYFRMLNGNDSMQDFVLDSAKRTADQFAKSEVEAMKREVEAEIRLKKRR